MNFRRWSQLLLLFLGVSISGVSVAQELDCGDGVGGRRLLVHVSHVSDASPALEMALYNMLCGANVNVLLCDEAALGALTDEATHPKNLGNPKHLNINALAFREGLVNLRQGLENFTLSRQLPSVVNCGDQGEECQVYVCLISLAKLYDLDMEVDGGLLTSFLDTPDRVDSPFEATLFEKVLYSVDSVIDF